MPVCVRIEEAVSVALPWAMKILASPLADKPLTACRRFLSLPKDSGEIGVRLSNSLHQPVHEFLIFWLLLLPAVTLAYDLPESETSK